MQGPAEHSVKAKKSYKADMSVAEHENDLEPYGTKIDSKRDIKSYASKKRMNNYSEQKISFDSKSVSQLHKRPSQKQYKKYQSRENRNIASLRNAFETRMNIVHLDGKHDGKILFPYKTKHLAVLLNHLLLDH